LNSSSQYILGDWAKSLANRKAANFSNILCTLPENEVLDWSYENFALANKILQLIGIKK